jgi:hypothetical protein
MSGTTFYMVVVREAGRKSAHLVLVSRRYRSKWWTVKCMGGGKRCTSGVCKHAAVVLDGLPPERSRVAARDAE